MINGKEVAFFLKRIAGDNDLTFFGEGVIHPFQLCSLKSDRDDFKDFSLVTPDFFLNFNAASSHVSAKLRSVHLDSLDKFMETRPQIAGQMFRCMRKSTVPGVKERRSFDDYRTSLFSRPLVKGEEFDLLLLFDTHRRAKKKLTFNRFLYQFDFPLPGNLTQYGIFTEDGNTGWFVAQDNNLQLFSDGEPPGKSFYFLEEGNLLEKEKVEFPVDFSMKKMGKSAWLIQLPFLMDSHDVRNRLCKRLCRIFKSEEMKSCLENCTG